MSSRLSRARAMLARRLAKRGVTLASAAMAHLVSQNAASAALPAALMKGTVEAASLVAAGAAGASGASPSATALAEGVLKAMLITKLRAVTVAILLLGAVGLGGLAGYRVAFGQDAGKPPARAGGGSESASAPVPKPAKKEDDAKLIQGTWVVVELHQVGREATKEEKEFFKKGGYKITITGEKMIHSPDNSEGKYRLDTAKKPRVLELLKDGKVIAKAIYELKDDDLRFCQGRMPHGDEEPEAPDVFDIKKAKAGTFPTLYVLKREATKKADSTASPQPPYDFRSSPRYQALPAAQQRSLEQAHQDFVLLWGALDLYARDHKGAMPEKLEALVPRYLKELPKDPFASKETGEERKLGGYVPSRGGWGYRYRPGRADSFVIASVGLPDFPYLAAAGNVGLYRARGLSGQQPALPK